MNNWQAEARRLVRERLAAEPGRVAALWAEVEAEAWQEVRAVVKAAMVEALLEELGRVDEETRRQGDKETRRQGDKETGRQGDKETGRQGDKEGVYVYGVVDCTELADLPASGVGENYPVTLHAYRDLAAVVSAAPLDQFGEEALKANLADMAWLEARVRAHQAVLDAVLPQAALVPMKFATIYFSPDGVEELLATRYDEFITQLAHLRGRREWGLKLYCDEARLVDCIAEVSPEVQRLRAEVESKPQGAAYLLARKLQETSAQEVERISLEVADDTHTRLAELSVAARLNPLQGPEITGRAERMLLNGAYLVDDAALDAFRAALAECAAQHGERGFQLELSGPWPAYNFVTLREDAAGATDG